MGNQPPSSPSKPAAAEITRTAASEEGNVISESTPLLPMTEKKDSVKEIREAYRDLIREENTLDATHMTAFYLIQGLLWVTLGLGWTRTRIWYFALFLSVIGMVTSLAVGYRLWWTAQARNQQEQEWEQHVGSDYKGPGIVGLQQKKLQCSCCPFIITKTWCRPVPITFALAWIGVLVVTIVNREDLR